MHSLLEMAQLKKIPNNGIVIELPAAGGKFLGCFIVYFYKESIIRLFDYSISTARARTKSRAQGWREHTNQLRMALYIYY